MPHLRRHGANAASLSPLGADGCLVCSHFVSVLCQTCGGGGAGAPRGGGRGAGPRGWGCGGGHFEGRSGREGGSGNQDICCQNTFILAKEREGGEQGIVRNW